MTNSDDLLKRLEGIADTLDITGLRASGEAVEQAAARIRELKAELEEADRQAKKLETLVEKVVSWDGKAPTHVIVPVEPTDGVLEQASMAFKTAWYAADNNSRRDAYRAMIRAAQEGDNG